MTIGDSLHSAIFDNPADDAPRLVYADWLDEHGQPERAEFIRVQIALVKDELDLDRRAVLQRREGELLQQYAEIFAGPLAGAGLHWVFRRGFVHRFWHDGLFQSANSYQSTYLRFLADGSLVSLTSTDSPERVMRSLDSLLPLVSRGRYSLDPLPSGLHVYFSSTDGSSTVDYTGIVKGQSILVDAHSHIQGDRLRQRYTRVDV